MHVVHRIQGNLAWLVIACILIAVAPRSVQANKVQLQAIGSLAAAHVYTSYGYVGVTADAYVAKSFTHKQVADLMGELNDMIDLNVSALQKVRAHVDGDDRKFLDDLIRVYGMVRKEAEALVAFAQSQEPADADRFEKSRKAVWPKLKILLGIDE